VVPSQHSVSTSRPQTRPVEWRIEQSQAIKTMIDESRDAMYDALWHDLRRNKTDADHRCQE